MVHRFKGTILRKRLRLHLYLLQLLQALIPEDNVLRRNFCTNLTEPSPIPRRVPDKLQGSDPGISGIDGETNKMNHAGIFFDSGTDAEIHNNIGPDSLLCYEVQ
ncbi:hypothetical protein ANN_00899 [Periplaneta americana]|uniref:Uncharacterized protein n=1 Tax=Periplaneta americana TaxID=6978 RepID=A0ABQ8TS20_PERAM|nr:hypothetical protein ANN_00899 [Periplaneta americana]